VFKESSKSGNEIEQRIERRGKSECLNVYAESACNQHIHTFLYFDKNSTHSHIPNPKLHLVSFAFTFNREAKKEIYLNHHVDFLTLLTPKNLEHFVPSCGKVTGRALCKRKKIPEKAQR
jgi:hypothetical protein